MVPDITDLNRLCPLRQPWDLTAIIDSVILEHMAGSLAI